MIVRRDTINMIATYRYKLYGIAKIARLMKIPAADIEAAVKAWRL
jgi:hypothetical protein